DLDLSPYVNRRFGISRRHALLRPSGSKVFLLDLNSTTGTRVNGSSVYPSRAMALQDGDIITLGSLTMTLSVQKAG
ncbi:MAG: FHA domain-containing protein, partial [Anaerolineae bacterium]